MIAVTATATTNSNASAHAAATSRSAPPAPVPAWVNALLASVDAKDTARFLGFLTPLARFRFANMPVARGQAEVRAAVDGFFAAIVSCRHSIRLVIESPGHVVCEGDVTYRRHDGGVVTLPFVNVFDMSSELIDDYRIYIDAAPLFAP
jgi:limonene-1,2-epoxide hydrolase